MSEPASSPDSPRKTAARPIWLNAAFLLIALAAGLIVYVEAGQAMGEAARRMAAIFAIAVVLWVTEGIPLFATSLLVIVLEAWWLAVPGGLNVEIDYSMIFAAVSHPIIFLFLGGFILARAVQQENLDVQMASLLLRPFGRRPASVLAGVMVITAIFSMWMSNTATTAMMIVLIQPLVLQVPIDERFRRALVLAVPFAANVGGVGTPIGTPPNAIALAELAQRGLTNNFVQWMLLGVPLLTVVLAAVWAFLFFVYRPRQKDLQLAIPRRFRLSFNGATVYLCFFITVGLWLTSPLHGIPTAVIAVLPAGVLCATRIIGRADFNRLDWDILILIAGGIALGNGVTLTGLDQWIVQAVPLAELPFAALLAVGCLGTLLLATVMSHTAAINILLPIGMAAAAMTTSGSVRTLAVLMALSASFAMALPISTPPNAMAYGTGQIRSRDFMLVGGLVSMGTTLLILLIGPLVIRLVLG